MTDIISDLYFDQLELHNSSPEYKEQLKICTEYGQKLAEQVDYELFNAYEEANSQLSSLNSQFYFRKGIQVAVQLILSGQAPL